MKLVFMKEQNQPTSISSLDSFKLDALSTFWQLDQLILDQLEAFIAERFKYPKGGGWDLDSLCEDIIFQNDLTLEGRTKILLPDEIAANRKLNFKNSDAIQLITRELMERYRPNLHSAKDHKTLRQISQVIYAMEAIRLGLLGAQIDTETPPSSVNKLL